MTIIVVGGRGSDLHEINFVKYCLLLSYQDLDPTHFYRFEVRRVGEWLLLLKHRSQQSRSSSLGSFAPSWPSTRGPLHGSVSRRAVPAQKQSQTL